MPWSDGLGFLVILNKSNELRFELGRSELIFGPGWSKSNYSLGGAPRVVGSHGTVSIVKIESLCSCWKPKSQEGNKSFVPEPRESSVFRVFFGFLCVWRFYEHYEHFIHILSVLPARYDDDDDDTYIHFRYPYHSYVTVALFSDCSSPLSKTLRIVPSALTTICITVNRIFNGFVCF